MKYEKLLTAKDLSDIFSISKNRAYELMKSSTFPSIKIGTRFYVSRKSLELWINQYEGREYLL